MSKAVKFGLLILGIAAWGGYEWFRSREPVTLRVTDFGIPSVNGSIVTIPLTVAINNTTGVTIPVDDLRIALSYLQNGSYVATGALSKANLNLQPGINSVQLSPTLDVRALFGNVLNTLATVLNNRGLDIKADVVMNFKGVTLVKSFTKKISI